MTAFRGKKDPQFSSRLRNSLRSAKNRTSISMSCSSRLRRSLSTAICAGHLRIKQGWGASRAKISRVISYRNSFRRAYRLKRTVITPLRRFKRMIKQKSSSPTRHSTYNVDHRMKVLTELIQRRSPDSRSRPVSTSYHRWSSLVRLKRRNLCDSSRRRTLVRRSLRAG